MSFGTIDESPSDVLKLIYPSPELFPAPTSSASAKHPCNEVDNCQDILNDVPRSNDANTLKHEEYQIDLNQEDGHQDDGLEDHTEQNVDYEKQGSYLEQGQEKE